MKTEKKQAPKANTNNTENATTSDNTKQKHKEADDWIIFEILH